MRQDESGERQCYATITLCKGFLTVNTNDGADECGHNVSAKHLAATNVGLVFLLGAQVPPADGLQLDDVGKRLYISQVVKVTQGLIEIM